MEQTWNNIPYTWNKKEDFPDNHRTIIRIIMCYLLKHRIGKTEMKEYANYSQIYILKTIHLSGGETEPHFNIQFICAYPRKSSSVKHIYFETVYTDKRNPQRPCCKFLRMTETEKDTHISIKNNEEYIQQNEKIINELQVQINYLQELKRKEEEQQRMVKEEQKRLKLEELNITRNELLERVRKIEMEMNQIQLE
jgi:hypothetical protein